MFILRRICVSLLAVSCAACSGGGGSAVAPSPTPSPAPFISFVPASINFKSSAFDYFGELTYTARTGLVPKPLTPPNGSMTCNDGLNIGLQIHQGPAPIGVVHDEYVVLPLNVQPAIGTVLNCTSTWGLYDSSGALVAQAPLQATVTYDNGRPAIYFTPAALAFKASAGSGTSVLAYATTAGFKPKPLSPDTGNLACQGGYTLAPKFRAGSSFPGYDQIRFELDPSAVSPVPPSGTTVACAATWGLADAAGNIVQRAALNVKITFDTKS
jgi:hypothetical protein